MNIASRFCAFVIGSIIFSLAAIGALVGCVALFVFVFWAILPSWWATYAAIRLGIGVGIVLGFAFACSDEAV